MPNQKKDTPMQITVRLYRQHDMDLVGLYRTKDFKFQRHMKNALKAYAEGKDYRINHPGDEDIRKGYVPKIVQMHIYLTVEQDADAISALKTIREGYRGAFLKALFRKYLNNEPLEAYKDRKDLIFNAEEDYLEAPEEAAGNKKEYDKSRKDFGKSGCDNSAGVSAKRITGKKRVYPRQESRRTISTTAGMDSPVPQKYNRIITPCNSIRKKLNTGNRRKIRKRCRIIKILTETALSHPIRNGKNSGNRTERRRQKTAIRIHQIRQKTVTR